MYRVHHAPGDADLLIVKKAVESAAIVNTGDDTDLLILLCYHASFDSQRIFFQSEPIAKKFTKNSEVQLSQINTFVNKPEHLVYSQLPLKMSLLQGNECWLAFTMGKTGKTLIPYATSNSVTANTSLTRISGNSLRVYLQIQH